MNKFEPFDYNCEQIARQAFPLADAVHSFLVAAETSNSPSEAAAARGAAAMATVQLIECARRARNESRCGSSESFQLAEAAAIEASRAERSLRAAAEREAVLLGKRKTSMAKALYPSKSATRTARHHLLRAFELVGHAMRKTVDDVSPDFLQVLLRARSAIEEAGQWMDKVKQPPEVTE